MDYDQKMDQRVKALEYEIKILKNEVQRTLLDIQEQILVHYYPDLRTETASADLEGAMHTLESIATKKAQMDSTAAVAQKAAAKKAAAAQPAPAPAAPVAPPPAPAPLAQSAPVQPVAPPAQPAYAPPEQPQAAPEAPPPAAPNEELPEAERPFSVQPVTLDQLRAGADGPTMSQTVNYRQDAPAYEEAEVVPSMESIAADLDASTADQTAALSGWVMETGREVGIERTVTIINTAVRRGLLPAEHQEILVRLTDQADESGVPAELAINKVLNAVLALQQVMGLQTNPDEAINLIDEANLG